METRPHFLILSPILVSIGTVVAVYEGFFNPLSFALALAGMVLAHVGGNVLNDYFDYKSGIDLETVKTPFSGGSGILPAGMLSPGGVYKLGLTSLLLGSCIGIYFIITKGWLLIPILIVAVVSAYAYSPRISKTKPPLGELVTGLNFGPMAIMGAFFVQTGFYSLGVVAASLAPGLLTANLLLINQFPDVEQDAKAGRRHLPIILGKERAIKIYPALLAAAYIWIVIGVAINLMPLTVLLGLATLPIALKAAKGALANYGKVEKLIPVLSANIMVVMLTQVLLAVGYVLAFLLHL